MTRSQAWDNTLVFDPDIDRTEREIRRQRMEQLNQERAGAYPVQLPLERQEQQQAPPPHEPEMPRYGQGDHAGMEYIPRPVPRPRELTYGEHIAPRPIQLAAPIVKPLVDRRDFEIKPAYIQMLQNRAFGGRAHEDPSKFLIGFRQLCRSLQLTGVTEEAVLLLSFPFALTDMAEAWYYSLPSNSIFTWEQMECVFFEKYYPPRKTQELKMKINNFNQDVDENLYEAWERFKGYQRDCPHHGYDRKHLIPTFVDGLRSNERNLLNAAAGGTIRGQTLERIETLIEEMAQEQGRSDRDDSRRRTDMRPKESANAIEELRAQISLLTSQLNKASSGSTQVYGIGNQEVYGAEGNYGVEEVSYANNPYSNTYNPGWRNHPNFSYKNAGNMQNQDSYQKPPFNQGARFAARSQEQQSYQYRAPQQPSKDEGIEEVKAMLTRFMAQSNGFQEEMNNFRAEIRGELEVVKTHLKVLDGQVAQIASSSSSAPPGFLPAKTVTNPRESNPREHVKAIMLRSGREIEGAAIPQRTAEKDSERKDEDTKNARSEEEEPRYAAPPPKMPPIPFPQRLRQANEDAQFGKFQQMLKKLEVTIPFTEAIHKIPSYAKFLKRMLAKKKKVESDMIMLNEECSAVLKHEMPRKMGDPGSFSIPCKVGNVDIKGALCDLGASVSVLPLSIYKRMNVGELKPTKMIIQLADNSLKIPSGIIEDVPLKIGHLYFPVDFVVLEMSEDANVPVILGRPLLSTANAIIDVRTGKLTMKIGDDSVEFDLARVSREPSTMERCCQVTTIDKPSKAKDSTVQPPPKPINPEKPKVKRLPKGVRSYRARSRTWFPTSFLNSACKLSLGTYRLKDKGNSSSTPNPSTQRMKDEACPTPSPH